MKPSRGRVTKNFRKSSKIFDKKTRSEPNDFLKAYKSLNFDVNMKKNTIDVQGSQMPVLVYPLGKF